MLVPANLDEITKEIAAIYGVEIPRILIVASIGRYGQPVARVYLKDANGEPAALLAESNHISLLLATVRHAREVIRQHEELAKRAMEERASLIQNWKSEAESVVNPFDETAV